MKKSDTTREKATGTRQNEKAGEAAIMTVQEVADYLRLSQDSVYKLVKRGEIPAAMILNKLRFERTTVRHYFRKKERGGHHSE